MQSQNMQQICFNQTLKQHYLPLGQLAPSPQRRKLTVKVKRRDGIYYTLFLLPKLFLQIHSFLGLVLTIRRPTWPIQVPTSLLHFVSLNN